MAKGSGRDKSSVSVGAIIRFPREMRIVEKGESRFLGEVCGYRCGREMADMAGVTVRGQIYEDLVFGMPRGVSTWL